MHLISPIMLLILLLCNNPSPVNQVIRTSDTFNDYWYTGLAELSSYELTQARYGEYHTGTAVIVMVTEPFSRKKHVKLDQPSSASSDAISVLKMNRQRSFNTGIYPYRVMTSVFTPIDTENLQQSLKSTNSVQEWCGHTYSQLNLESSGRYEAKLFSYFESEGDETHTVKAELLEDELFTQIRLNPDLLPTGITMVIPSQTYNRFLHKKAQAYEAFGQIERLENGLSQYTLNYKNLPRRLKIQYSSDSPYTIEGWEEEFKGLTTYAPTQITTAKLINRTRTDYWNKNNVSDTILYNDLMRSRTSID